MAHGCTYCTDDFHCEKFTDEKYTSWCYGKDYPCKDRRISKADRIRAMTDEELAELLTAVAKKSADKLCESLKTVEVDLGNCNFHILYEAHLDWLRQEAAQ